jgi:hypothetical protein
MGLALLWTAASSPGFLPVKDLTYRSVLISQIWGSYFIALMDFYLSGADGSGGPFESLRRDQRVALG